jgi:hypothetical protein
MLNQEGAGLTPTTELLISHLERFNKTKQNLINVKYKLWLG